MPPLMVRGRVTPTPMPPLFAKGEESRSDGGDKKVGENKKLKDKKVKNEAGRAETTAFAGRREKEKPALFPKGIDKGGKRC